MASRSLQRRALKAEPRTEKTIRAIGPTHRLLTDLIVLGYDPRLLLCRGLYVLSAAIP